MTKFKRLLKFISSMRFALILLAVLLTLCILGSIIPQGRTYASYSASYSERTAGLIMALHLDDVFHSPFFIIISAFVCINLLLCNVLRLPSLISRTKAFCSPSDAGGAVLEKTTFKGTAEELAAFYKVSFKESAGAGAAGTAGTGGGRVLYSIRNTAGLWGAWICHIGVLLLILGYGLGQMTYKEYTVYGVPGDTRRIGDTALAVTIDDFRIDKRSDGSVEQYISNITVYDLSSASEGRSAEVSVNNPADLYGLRFYQNSTGWAARIRIYKNGEVLQDENVCAGEYLSFSDNPDLTVYFNAFYPENPAYLYSVYYRGQILGMNLLENQDVISIDDYTVTFSEAQNYTLIQIKRDSFSFLAFAGSVIIFAGLALAFYVPSRKITANEEEEGVWSVTVRGRR